MNNDKIAMTKCPSCGKEIKFRKPDKYGTFAYKCPQCGNTIKLVIKEELPTEIKGRKGGGKCMLEYGGVFGLAKKKASLHTGDNIIGRYDLYRDSEISIHGDKFISRRSASVFEEPMDEGYLYSLKILHSTNEAKCNGTTIVEGECISLSPGDTFTLGKTVFKLVLQKV